MSKNGDRETLFLENLAIGIPLVEAGLKAGYSPSYCTGTLRRKLISPDFLKKVQAYCDDFPEKRQTLARLRLGKVYQIEENILNKAMVDDDYATRPVVSKTMEREYRLTGLLQDDHAKPVQVQINLAVLQGTQEQTLESITVGNSVGNEEDD